MKSIVYLFCLVCCSIQAQSWKTCSELPAPGRDDGIAFQLNGKGYVVTGNQGGFSDNVIWEYDIQQDSWIAIGNFPGEARQYSVALTLNNYAYIIGGFSTSNTPLSDCWRMDAKDKSWLRMADFPGVARWAAVGFVSDTAIYICCGTTLNGTVNDVWRYSVISDKWYQTGSFPGVGRRDAIALSNLDHIVVGTGFSYQTNSYLNDFYSFDLKKQQWNRIENPPFSPRSYVTSTGPVLAGGIDSAGTFLNDAYYLDYQWKWTRLNDLPVSGIKGMSAFQDKERVYFGTGLNGDFQRVSTFYSTIITQLGNFLNEVIIYPNPGCKGVKIKGPSGISFQIYTQTGQLIVEDLINEFGWRDLPDSNPGTYYIRFPDYPTLEVLEWIQFNCY